MTPKEKAKELVNKFDIDLAPFSEYGYWDKNQAKKSALIAVDELIDQVYSISHQYTAIYDENTKFWNYTESNELKFWKEVEKEIKVL